MSPEEYRDQAAECLRLAGQVTHVKAKLALIDMAHMWLRLADHAEKNGETDLVYAARAPKLDGAAGDPAAS